MDEITKRMQAEIDKGKVDLIESRAEIKKLKEFIEQRNAELGGAWMALAHEVAASGGKVTAGAERDIARLRADMDRARRVVEDAIRAIDASAPASAPQPRKAATELTLKELAAEFAAVADLGCDYVLSADACKKLFDAMTTPPATAPQVAVPQGWKAELIDLLISLRPNYGDVGSRDVDVAAQRNRIDQAIDILAAAPDAPAAEKAPDLSSFDTGYIGRKLALVARDLSHYTAQEMARELVRLAKVADEKETSKEATGTDAHAAPDVQPVAVDGVHWDLLPGYLIDHCEGDTITEEGLQHRVSDMLLNANYKRIAAERATTAAQQVAPGEALQFLLNVVRDAVPMLRAADFGKTADAMEVAAREAAPAPAQQSKPSDLSTRLREASSSFATALCRSDIIAAADEIDRLAAADLRAALAARSTVADNETSRGYCRSCDMDVGGNCGDKNCSIAAQPAPASGAPTQPILGYAIFRSGKHVGTERLLEQADRWTYADVVALVAASDAPNFDKFDLTKHVPVTYSNSAQIVGPASGAPEVQGQADDGEMRLLRAMDAAYPIPDSPHGSVLQHATDNRAAFKRGFVAASGGAQLRRAPTLKEPPPPPTNRRGNNQLTN